MTTLSHRLASSLRFTLFRFTVVVVNNLVHFYKNEREQR